MDKLLIFEKIKLTKMKKITIVFSAAMMMAIASFAGDGNKDKGCCSKDKKRSLH